MSLTPKDLDFVEVKNAAAREIALALGVPPLLLGIPGDNTYSNYAEANSALWRQTIIPLVNRLASALSVWLCGSADATTSFLSPSSRGEGAPGLDPGAGEGQLPLRFVPDLDDIEALAPERDALWKRLESTSFLTTDEKRALAGYGPANEISNSHKVFNPAQPRDDHGRWTDGGGVDPVAFRPKLPGGAKPPPTAKPPTTEPQYKKPKSGQSGKEAASDIPSWAQGERPYVGEDGKAYAKRLLDKKYGEGKYLDGPNTEFNRLRKYGDRHFED